MISTAIALAALGGQLTGNALLDELQHRAVNFFWTESNAQTGFTKDRASNFGSDVDTHTVASIAATGFALAAYPIGVERHWLDRKLTLQRTLDTLTHIRTTLEGAHGFYYHFIDWTNGKRVWNCELSSIDTAILFSGVIVAEEYWHDRSVSRLGDSIVRAADWRWMTTDGGSKPNEPFVSMGWHPEAANPQEPRADGSFISSRWSSYCELPMIYLLGYGTDPSLAGDQGWDKVARPVVDYAGFHYLAGGPLFMHQMALNFFNFGEKRDRPGFNYWFSTQQATLGNRAYCIENPKHFKDFGPDFWGLSACDTPDGYQALGAPNDVHDNGTITPTSAIASLAYTPKESIAFAEAMYRDHQDAFGKYGFSNGVCPTRNWNDPDALGIDLGMMLIGVENGRTGMIWKLTDSSPIVKSGFRLMGFKAAPGSNDGPLQVTGK